MVSRNRNHFGSATGAAGGVTRGAARFGGRIITSALGTFLGVAAANRVAEENELKAKPEGALQRAEANTIYAEHENDNAPTVGGPVTIQAGSVTVTEGAAAGAAGGAALAGAVGGGGGGSPSRASTGRSEGAGGAGRSERAPALPTGSSNGGSGGGGRGGSTVAASGSSRSDNGRFEAGGGGSSRPSRASRGADRRDPVDLSDYDFDELADIFRPEPQKAREQPRPPVKPTMGAEAGRGR
jgi:hypothetical protein